jgi:hypothetical protein
VPDILTSLSDSQSLKESDSASRPRSLVGRSSDVSQAK